MLELNGLTLRGGRRGYPEQSVRDVSTRFKPDTLCGVIAPPGSGGSTLIEVIAGVWAPELGEVMIRAEKKSPPAPLKAEAVAWVPGSPVLGPSLSARAHIGRAAALRGLTHGRKRERVETVISDLGISESAGRSLKGAGPGTERLATLGCALVGRPKVIVADGMLDGLSPADETRALKALKRLASDGRHVMVRLDAPRLLGRFDTVLVFNESHIAFHGAPELLCHYFSIEKPDDLFGRLAERSGDDWHRSWIKHGGPYTGEPGTESLPPPTASGEIRAGDAVFFRKPEPVSPVVPTESSELAEPGKGLDENPPFAAGWMPQMGMALGDRLAGAMRSPLHLAGIAALLALLLVAGNYPIAGGFSLLADAAERVRAAELLAGYGALLAALIGLFGALAGAGAGGSTPQTSRWETRLGWTPQGWILGRAGYVALVAGGAGLLFGAAAGSMPGLAGAIAPLMATGLLSGLAAGMLGLMIGALVPCPRFALAAAPATVLAQIPLAGIILAPPHLGEMILRPLMAVYWGWIGFASAFAQVPAGSAMKGAVSELVPLSWLWAWLFLFAHIALAIGLAVFGRSRQGATRS
jgi:ABC-type multidrug transport system ATPase subunit